MRTIEERIKEQAQQRVRREVDELLKPVYQQLSHRECGIAVDGIYPRVALDRLRHLLVLNWTPDAEENAIAAATQKLL